MKGCSQYITMPTSSYTEYSKILFRKMVKMTTFYTPLHMHVGEGREGRIYTKMLSTI